MWIVFTIFALLWLTSIEFFLPAALTLLFFAAMIASGAFAVLPSLGSSARGEHRGNERIYTRW
ncbi:MAG TPA: hypothetical protein VN622_11765 [Clostridia bacterium]|nr:hypothetical protein [Clostridia bacterium]